eukprot:Amastigsp_a176364_3.p2 type:complete len:160 gc:universal Amastigsp_a176364_3:456-935(+)
MALRHAYACVRVSRSIHGCRSCVPARRRGQKRDSPVCAAGASASVARRLGASWRACRHSSARRCVVRAFEPGGPKGRRRPTCTALPVTSVRCRAREQLLHSERGPHVDRLHAHRRHRGRVCACERHGSLPCNARWMGARELQFDCWRLATERCCKGRDL